MSRWAALDRGCLIAGSRLRPGSALAEPRRPFPWLVLLLVLLLLGGATAFAIDQIQQRHAQQAPPTPARGPIDQFHLQGPRGPSCLRLVIGVDDSGSMNDFASARDAALAELFRWVPGQLRSDDQVAVVDFALETVVRIPATPLPSLGPAPHAPSVTDGADTLLAPVGAAVAAMPSTSCDVALVLLSDARLADLPRDQDGGRRFQNDHGLHDIDLLVPGESVNVPPQWSHAFPESPPRFFDGLDTDATALAVARTIAELTGQELAS